MSKKYCIKEALFFAVTDKVVESNLTKEEADERVDSWNEGADLYTDYFVTEQKEELV